MNDDIEILRQHLETLEYRLEQYHEQLTEAVRERDEVAVDAAWGIVQAWAFFQSAINGAVIAIVAYFLVSTLASKNVAFILASVVWFLAQWIIESRSSQRVQTARIEEKGSLAPLPEWKSEASRLF